MANVLHVLALHPAWAGVLAYDAFAECVVCRMEPPVREQDAPKGSMLGDWTDEHSVRTAAWIASEADFDAPTTMIDQAVATLAQKQIVHPVREYLDALKWDGVARLDEILPKYFGTLSTQYTRVVGARYMISAVARIQSPGCQVDTMLVIEGNQGQKKSTGVEALCKDKSWFADTGINLGDKDSYQCLRRKWIYEFGELSSVKGREVTKVKNFVSARSDNYRPSYGRRNRDFPRQVVFCGTTNDEHYLSDQTGNRRFWPVRCVGKVDVEAIRRDRDQLWAEAVARYKSDEIWHIEGKDLMALFEAEQAERQAPEDWIPIVSDWLIHPTVPDGNATRKVVNLSAGVTTAQVLLGAINMRAESITQNATMRAARVLRDLGFAPTPNPVRRDGLRTRVYVRVSADTASPENDQGVPDGCAGVYGVN